MEASSFCLQQEYIDHIQASKVSFRFFAARCYASAAMPSCGVCVSVRPSVMFADSVKTNKHIFNFFLRSGSHTILAFPYQSSWQYSDWDPSNGASNAGGVDRNRDSEPISGSIACGVRLERQVQYAQMRRTVAS